MSLLDFGKNKKKGPKIEAPKLQKGNVMYARELYAFVGEEAFKYDAGAPTYYVTLLLGKISNKTGEPGLADIQKMLGEIGMVSLDDVAEALSKDDMETVLAHVEKKYHEEPATSPSETPN